MVRLQNWAQGEVSEHSPALLRGLLSHTILYHLNKACVNTNPSSIAWQGGGAGEKSPGLILNQPCGDFSTMSEGSPD